MPPRLPISVPPYRSAKTGGNLDRSADRAIAKQMSLAFRLGPILVVGSIVQDHVVVDELDIARLERDSERIRLVVGERVRSPRAIPTTAS